ncbi:hypothetical protein FHG87_012648 [Trinorchestia longiramus]|nr:hypothetical protein FHG87_012648 [Trinorchestia longiramus]
MWCVATLVRRCGVWQHWSGEVVCGNTAASVIIATIESIFFDEFLTSLHRSILRTFPVTVATTTTIAYHNTLRQASLQQALPQKALPQHVLPQQALPQLALPQLALPQLAQPQKTLPQ